MSNGDDYGDAASVLGEKLTEAVRACVGQGLGAIYGLMDPNGGSGWSFRLDGFKGNLATGEGLTEDDDWMREIESILGTRPPL